MTSVTVIAQGIHVMVSGTLTHPGILQNKKVTLHQWHQQSKNKQKCPHFVPCINVAAVQESDLFCRHLSGQNPILPNKVQWSALLPGSSCLEPTPCFCPSFYIYQFFQVFLENLSLFKNPPFTPIAQRYKCVCVCVCVCVCACCMHWIVKTCTFKDCVSIYGLCGALGAPSTYYYY